MGLPLTPQPGAPPPPQKKIEIPALDPATWIERLLKRMAELNFLGALLRQAIDVILELVGAAIGTALNLLSGIAEFFVRNFDETKSKASAGVSRLASAALKDIADVDVDPAVLAGGGAGGNAAAQALGKAILDSMIASSGASGAAPGGLQPSSAAAEIWVGRMARMSIQDWLIGFFAECTTAGQVESWGELGDNLFAALGLGRVSRQALSPLIDVAMATPLEWQVNKTYRPRLLSVAQCVRAFRAGFYTEVQFREELARLGYSEQRITALLVEHTRRLSVTDLDALVSGRIWTRDQAVTQLVQDGYDRPTAEALLALAEDRRIDPYRRQWAQIAVDAFVRGDLDAPALHANLDRSGLDERERAAIARVAGQRKELRTKSLSLSDLEAAIKRGILTIAEYRAELRKDGYDLRSIEVMELLLLSDVRDADAARKEREKREAARVAEKAARDEAARKRREEIERQLAVREVSLSQMERLVRAGQRSLDDYRTLLADQRYSQADQDSLTDLLEADIARRLAAAEAREEARRRAAVRRIALGDLEQLVRRGLASVEEYEARLVELGFDPPSVAQMAELLRDEVADAAAALEARDRAKAKAAERDIPLDVYERAIRRGLADVDQFDELLVSRGFDVDEAALMAAVLREQLRDDQDARRRRDEAARRAAERRIPLGDLEDAVRRGLRPMADYRAELVRLGFVSPDIDVMVALVQLDIDAAKDAAARRKADEERARVRGISLGDLEAAVRIGVAPIGTYQAYLQAALYDKVAQSIMVQTLAAQVAAVQRQRAERARETARAQARGVSVADIEAAVRAGLRSIGEYQARLGELGFTPAAAAVMVDLLRTEVEATAAARRRRAEVEARAAERRISLGDFERAVVEGLRSMDDYRALLRDLGVVAPDQVVLVGLLAIDVERAAAKRAGG